MMSRRLTAGVRRRCAFFALVLVLACGEEHPPRQETPASPGATEAPESPETTPSAFSAELTRFEDDVAAFEDLDSCKEALGSALPSSLGDLLADLRYERVVDDVCVGLAAAAERDITRCDELATSGLQAGCRRRVARLLEDPSLCAASDSDVDTSCLAGATGRSELCAAAPSHARAVCQALARGDASLCEESRVPSEATCRSLVARHGPLEVRPESAALETNFNGVVMLPSGETHLRANVGRGLLLRRERCIPALTIEGQGSPRVNIDFGDASGAARLRYFDGQTLLGIATEVHVRDLVVNAHLGGRISGNIDTEVELDGHVHPLNIEFTTYVRNWLDPSECPEHDGALDSVSERSTP